MPSATYSIDQAVSAFYKAGIKANDVVYSHVGLLQLGFPLEMRDGLSAFDVIYRAIREVIGAAGTFLTPTYTYSFCDGEYYDPDLSESKIGAFGNYFRKQENVVRSLDPIFSVAGSGPLARQILENLPNESFGSDCVYARLEQVDAIQCNIGVDLFFSTSVHYIENSLKVPYRFNKLFWGQLTRDGRPQYVPWIYYVRVLGKHSFPRFDRLQAELIKTKQCAVEPLGLGFIYKVPIKILFETARNMISQRPSIFAEQQNADPMFEEITRVPARKYSSKVPDQPTTAQLVKALVDLPRDLISDGYDYALMLLAKLAPMNIHEYRSGTECISGIVPEKWTCQKATLETLAGLVQLDYENNPLHVVSYSQSFMGEVTREELFNHLHIHPTLPEAIPYKCFESKSDWGLCCTNQQKARLADDSYRVTIDAQFSYGALKVGQIVIPGNSQSTVLLSAHLGHSGQFNDGLSGVIAGVKIMQHLAKLPKLHYSYRMLISPHTFGVGAWLSNNQTLVPHIIGGICLDMLARNQPLELRLTKSGNTEFDEICRAVIMRRDANSVVWEAQETASKENEIYCSQVLGLPMVVLSRCLPVADPNYPFREHHSSTDNLEFADLTSLTTAVEAVIEIITVTELKKITIPKPSHESTSSDFDQSV